MSREDGIGRADWIVAAGGVALAAFLFLFDWYGGSIVGLSVPEAGLSSTGWEAFTDSRWVWLVTIALALVVLPAARVGLRRRGQVQLSAVVLMLAALSSVLIAFRIVHHPGANVSGASVRLSYEIKPGIWLGLAAALTITAGAGLQLYAERPRPEGQAAEPLWRKVSRRTLAVVVALPERFARAGKRVAARKAEREQRVESEPAKPAFSGLTVPGAQPPAGERRPGQAP